MAFIGRQSSSRDFFVADFAKSLEDEKGPSQSTSPGFAYKTVLKKVDLISKGYKGAMLFASPERYSKKPPKCTGDPLKLLGLLGILEIEFCQAEYDEAKVEELLVQSLGGLR